MTVYVLKWYTVVVCCCIQLFCDPMDCSLPGSSVHGIFQTKVLEWVAISFSRGSSQPRDWNLCPVSPPLQVDSLSLNHQGIPFHRKYLQEMWYKPSHKTTIPERVVKYFQKMSLRVRRQHGTVVVCCLKRISHVPSAGRKLPSWLLNSFSETCCSNK